MIRQRTDEWYAIRRTGVTSTDIAAILGISPYRSEGDVAREKLTGEREEPDAATARRFRLGHALEDVIRGEDVAEHGIALRRVNRFIVDPNRPRLMTSLDFERVGERTIVEAKSGSGRAWEHGLPEHVEAQVRWQMGVARYPRVHVAALRFGTTLDCYDLDHDEATFAGLVVIAEDFLRRLDAGGPFAENRDSTRRAWPVDDGDVIDADAELAEAVLALVETRKRKEEVEAKEDALLTAIQTRMGPAAMLRGPGWRVTWKRSKDSEVINYKPLALDALGLLDATTIDELTARHTETRPGTRRFLIKMEDER